MKTIVFASNKGGTGKTTMSCALARSFAEIAPTALLDTDVTGPDVMNVLGMPFDHAIFDLDHFYPVQVTEHLQVFSPAMIIPETVGVTWTGDLRGEMIRELMERVVWNGEPEYLIIDSPPSTSDELLTVLLQSNPSGVVIVTLGSDTSISDAKRLLAVLLNEKFNIPVIGYIRNMVDVFGKGDLDGVTLLGDVMKTDVLDVSHIRDNIVKRLEESE
ncbi:MAG: P-loop NTPase [Nitrospiraceae bacterium]|nr:P-loop NTPase [Nitrospiraceae bacterium]